MGLDFYEVVLEVEKEFGVQIAFDDLETVWNANNGDCTVAEFHDVVCRKCLESGVPVPRSSWNKIRLVFVRALRVKVNEVRRDVWLRRDLEFI